ncbi:MAG: hypothetical protein WAM97_09470 [Acidimicrobiales bacterium]
MSNDESGTESSGSTKESTDSDEVDEWGEESFPASDPPGGWSGPPEED